MDIEDLEKQAEAIRIEQIKLYELYADGVLLRDAYIEMKKKIKVAMLTSHLGVVNRSLKELMKADYLDDSIRPTVKAITEFKQKIPQRAIILAAVLLKKRQMLRLTQQEIADRAKITLRKYQRLESGERNILTSSFGLACRVIEALDMYVSKFYHGDYYLEEEVKTMRGKGIASRKKSSI